MDYVAHEILGEGSILHDKVMYKIWWSLDYDTGLNQGVGVKWPKFPYNYVPLTYEQSEL